MSPNFTQLCTFTGSALNALMLCRKNKDMLGKKKKARTCDSCETPGNIQGAQNWEENILCSYM